MTHSIRKLNRLAFLPLFVVLFSGCQINKQPMLSSYSIVYSSHGANGREIYLIDENGESGLKVTSQTGYDGYPSVSPDGKRIAFYGKYDNRKTWSIHSINVDGENVQRLTNVKNVWDSAPTWSPDGEIIAFAREYQDPQKGWQEEIWLMNNDGSNQRQIKALKGRAPYFLPDGKILFHSKTGPSQICIADIDGGNLIKLTNNDANDWSPKVSPDGTQIVFVSNRDGNQEIYTMNIDGSQQKRITFNETDDWGPIWSDDGSKILFTSDSIDSLVVYKVNKDGSSKEKIINNGSQLARVKNLNKHSLEKLIKTQP
ncbi:TolB family protein [Pseudoalteromonas sp. H105]|jgi:TolB protein|uniref:TolB family protein n=1 Tax=Pseudoalteromonas sp. H105 TaxID=1348393 RepID=UPI000A907396|nr:DUF5050 domain-containing protein [Pseudoalteromonas sp. H105]